MENYFKEDLTVEDKEIAKAIVDISTDVTAEKMEIIFELGVNPWLKEGTFSRRYPMQDGQPVKVEGDKVTWLKKKPEGGVLSAILDGG